MGRMDLIEFSLIGAALIAIAYRKIKVFSHSQISATRITPPFTTQDSNYLCCQWIKGRKQNQKSLNKSNFLCVARASYLQFRAMQRAARLVPFIALWAVLNFTEEGGGKGRESGKN